MQSPAKPWESTSLQTNRQLPRSSLSVNSTRSVPVLPPRPQIGAPNTNYASYTASPYSTYGGYNGYGAMGSYSPYRSTMYGMYGMSPFGGYANPDDAERRFIHYVEERSRNTFSGIENVVRAVSSLSMMLDNTFFAVTSSFRAVLGVAENFGRLRSVFGQIWYTLNVFRLLGWLRRRLLVLLGRRAPNSSVAWKEAVAATAAGGSGGGLSTLAFFGLLFSAPYFISKLLPKYEDKSNPQNWKSPGIRAKAAFDFRSTSPDELSFDVNDEVTLAPTYVQEELKLTNTGWAFAVCKGRSGYVPLNYLVLSSVGDGKEAVIPRKPLKSSLKRVSFGENQVFTPNESSYEQPTERKDEANVDV